MSEDDGVGYKKPPKHSRFKKGQSGNPKGRPKGRKNMATHLDRILNERIRIKEGDKVFKITKGEAMLKSLMQKALKGDAKAISLMMAALRHFGDDAPAAAAGSFGVLAVPGMIATEEDWAKLAQQQEDRDDDEDESGS